MGAGLGGGSIGCRDDINRSQSTMAMRAKYSATRQLGVQLGADVPIFVHGRNAWAEGVGEHLTFIRLRSKTIHCVKT